MQPGFFCEPKPQSVVALRFMFYVEAQYLASPVCSARFSTTEFMLQKCNGTATLLRVIDTN